MRSLFTTHRLQTLVPAIREFIGNEIVPLEKQFLREPFGAIEPILKEKRQQVKKRGWWTPHLPEPDGGMGLTLMEFAQVSEELGRTPLGHYVFNCQAPDIGNMELLHKFGTAHQKEQFLLPLIRGEIRSCFSMTEPELPGSNPILLHTTATKEDNQYVINGHKWFTTAADGAAFAIVMAVTTPDHPNPYARASMLIVPTQTPGFQLVRNIPIMGESGEGYSSHAEIRYQDCWVPADNLLGTEGSGFILAQERLGPGRIHHCMRWIGICERAFDLLCQRAATRQVGPGEYLGHKQTVQHWIAECRAQINAARLMVLHTAYQMEAEGQEAVREEVSTLKFFVANVLQQVIDRAIQVHGALGITDDTILAYWYRHERGARIYDGPDEVHKSVLARRILKGYGLNSK